MVAITNPGTRVSEFSGEFKLLSLYNLSIASASDALTLSFADNGITSIQNVVATINAGQDGDFTAVAASFSGLIVTVTSVQEDGTDSDTWSDTTVNLVVIGK